MKQFFAGHQCQNRVAQKLQLFVVVDPEPALPSLLRLLFPSLRTVGESLLDHRPAVEVVVQRRFQCSDFPFFHDETTRTRSSKSSSKKRTFPGCGTGLRLRFDRVRLPAAQASLSITSRVARPRWSTASADPFPCARHPPH